MARIAAELRDVPGDAVVGVMAYELRGELYVLIADRLVAVLPAPVVDRDQGAGEAAFRRPLPHHVLALLRLRPGVGEAEKVERPVFAVRMRAILALGTEVDEARLVGMEREPEPSKALRQHFHDPFGVVVVLERHHEVISKSNQRTTT